MRDLQRLSTSDFVDDPGIAAEFLASVRAQGFGTMQWTSKPGLEELEPLFNEGALRIEHRMEEQGEGRGEYGHLSDQAAELLYPFMSRFYAVTRSVENYSDFAATLPGYWDQCAAAGQTESAVLALEHGPDGYNALHTDDYGPMTFPYQCVLMMSQTGVEFTGGAFVLEFSRPGSPAELVVPPFERGDLLVFRALDCDPDGAVGRPTLRHGVTRVFTGKRRTVGMVFHRAKPPGGHLES